MAAVISAWKKNLEAAALPEEKSNKFISNTAAASKIFKSDLRLSQMLEYKLPGAAERDKLAGICDALECSAIREVTQALL